MENSHIKRWLTALIATPLLILLILKGGAFLFGLFIVTIAIIGFYEWNKITDLNYKSSLKTAKNVSFFLIPFLVFSSYGSAYLFSLCALICCGIILFLSIKGFDGTREHLTGSTLNITGFIYVCIFLSFAFMIRLGADGIQGVFFLVICVFASDTGAYYAGKMYGKTKLMPKVSPKKTIEGFAGGFLLSVLAAILCRFIFFESLGLLNAFLCGCAAGIFVPLGDLFESMTKRACNVKDSGNILPGHGGILDRIDGLLFAAPLIYLLINF